MKPREIYEKMLGEITDDDRRAVARLFLVHIGEENRIAIEEIAAWIFGSETDYNVRKTRQVIEDLIELHAFPICSHSGRAGRWLASSRDEAEAAAAEREARANKLILSARKLRSAWLPANMPVIRTAVQPELMTYYSETMVPAKLLKEKWEADRDRTDV